ncbi:MAG: hypothetical protein K6A42_04590 [Treponema sp.]|nr:hypothetical protein [Treponema sp.]
MEILVKIWYNKIIMLAKPFVKWVGGKSQLLEEIREKYPQKIVDDGGVPAKAVGCSALRYRSSSSLCCGGLFCRCFIA